MTYFLNISQKLAILGAASMATCAIPTAVNAHAVLTEQTALTGSYYKGAVRIGHGCEGAATITFGMVPISATGARSRSGS